MASSSLNEANLEKRLQNVTNTQESIQTLSLWCLHHKAHYFKIVQIWTKVFKTAKINHRLALFYLANDVIQNSKRKGFLQFGEAWMPSIKETIPLVTEEKIKAQMDRILTVWEERNVYDIQFIKELRALFDNIGRLVNVNPEESSDAKLLVDFKPQKLVDKLKKFKKLEAEVELKQKQFTGLKLDVCSTETLKQLKDKAHGTKFTKDFEDATNKLDEFVQILHRSVKERNSLIEMLEESSTFYDTQRKEAKIVANAYKNFGSRVKNLQGKLEEMLPKLSSPIPSPSFDAPSPEDSSVENSPSRDGKKDNTEAVDMEMSDDEDNAKNKDDSSSVGSAPSPDGSPVGLSTSPVQQPFVPTTAKSALPDTKTAACFLLETLRKTTNTIASPSMSSSTSQSMASSLDIRLSNLMHSIPNFATNLFGGRPLGDAIKLTPNSAGLFPEGGATPLKDEESGAGSATPLQDENREINSKTKVDVPNSNTASEAAHKSSPEAKKNVSSKLPGTKDVEPKPLHRDHARMLGSVKEMQLQTTAAVTSPMSQHPEKSKTLTNNHGRLDSAQANVLPGSSGYIRHSNVQFPPANGDDVLNAQLAKAAGDVAFRRNSNIVQLTPSPRASPNINADQGQVPSWIAVDPNISPQKKCDKNSHPTKASVDDSSFMIPIRPLSDTVFLPSTLNPPKKSTITINLRNPKNAPALQEFDNELSLATPLLQVPNASNLRTIVPFGADLMDNMSNADEPNSRSAVQQPIYSKIETLDSSGSRDPCDYWDQMMASSKTVRSVATWSLPTQPIISRPRLERQCPPRPLIPQQQRHPSNFDVGRGFRPPWRSEHKPQWNNPGGPLPKRPFLMSNIPPARWTHYRPQY